MRKQKLRGEMTRPRPHSQNSNSGVLILNYDPRHHLAKYGPSPTMVTSFVLLLTFVFWSYSWLQGDSSDLSSEQPLKLFETCSISDADHEWGRKDTQHSLWDFITHSGHDYWLSTYSVSHDELGAGDAALNTAKWPHLKKLIFWEEAHDK